MFNVEQELEMCGNGYEPGTFEVVNARVDGDTIYVNLRRPGRTGVDYYDWPFCAKTGIHRDQGGIDNPLRIRPKSATRPITHYFLHAGMSEWEKDQWVKCNEHKFDNGKDAAAEMKRHNGLFSTHLSPFRMMVKPETELSPVRDYPAWAEFRFESGEYVPLPWANEAWFKENQPEHHFARFASSDNCMVAFWESEANAQRDHASILTPGRYLTRYFSTCLTETEIQQWAVKADAECDLLFAHTPDEIEEVYTARGAPSSCMSHSLDEYSSDEHPVRVYGAGDLAVAYLQRRGKIIARALCWPDRKVVGRRYGDIDRLTNRMRAEGWTIDSDDSSASGRGSGGLEGARLLRIEQGSAFIMPYIDAGYGVTYPPSTMPDKDKYLVLTRGGGDIGCYNTCGLSDEPEYDYSCDSCGEGLYDDDAYHIQGSTYCEFHWNENTRECYHCETRVWRADTTLVDDERYCGICYDEHTFSCDYCGERTCSTTPIYDARSEFSELAPGDQDGDACQGCIDDNDNLQPDVNGRWINTETANQCGFSTCGAWFSRDLDECPNPTCAENRAANNNETQTEEVEAA